GCARLNLGQMSVGSRLIIAWTTTIVETTTIIGTTTIVGTTTIIVTVIWSRTISVAVIPRTIIVRSCSESSESKTADNSAGNPPATTPMSSGFVGYRYCRETNHGG